MEFTHLARMATGERVGMKNRVPHSIFRMEFPSLAELALIVVAAVNLSTTSVSGGDNVWTPSGPPAAHVTDLAVVPSNPAILYAATDGGGVYKSVNGGKSWTLSNRGLGTHYVSALAIARSDPRIVYAGTDAGVFKSTDGASTWTAMNTEFEWWFEDLVVDPANPSVLYAAGGTLWGVVKSIDAGRSWTKTGLYWNQYVQELAVDPLSPEKLYAASVYPALECSVGDIFKTTDGGSIWTSTGLEICDDSPISLAIDPTNGDTLYAGTGANGLYSITFSVDRVTY